MEKKKRRIPLGTLLLFIASALLLVGSSIGGAQAALTYYSDTYVAQMSMNKIGVTLLENGAEVAFRNYGNKEQGNWEEGGGGLLQKMIPEGEALKLGYPYEEVLSVRNSGTIPQYARVNIYKYWVQVDSKTKEEKKCPDLSPGLIEVGLDNTSAWLLDDQATTDERIVLYYNKPLAAGETSLPFSRTLTINGYAAASVTQEPYTYSDGRKVIRTIYDYNGVEFRLEVEANAVQTGHAQDAIRSAWGRDVAFSGDTLRLVN